MRLKYKILWFEDVDSAFDTLKEYVEGYLEKNGFQVDISRYTNDDDGIRTILSKTDFDLILMDYALDGVRGDEVIASIRDQELFTEVVFYSTSSTREIRASIAEKEIDGVYCTSRQISEFEEKVIKVINNTIKKVQDINNMRGLVIAEAIDLENGIKEMLQQYFEIITGDTYDAKQKKVLAGICSKKIKFNQEETAFIGTIQTLQFEQLLERKYFLTSMNLFHALQDVLKTNLTEININLNGKLDEATKGMLLIKKEALIGMKEELNSFENEIIKLRNILAHAKEKVDEAGIPFLEGLSNDGLITIFTSEKYIEIRKSIKKHSDNLNSIVKFLSMQQTVGAEAAAGK